MNIHNAIGEYPKKLSFQDSHKPGEHDQINFSGLKRVYEDPFRCVVELGAELARRNEHGTQPPFAGPLKNSRVRHIAGYDCDLGRNTPGNAGVRNGDEVGAFARTEDTEPKFFLVIHGALFLAELR